MIDKIDLPLNPCLMNFLASKRFIAFLTGCIVFVFIHLAVTMLWSSFYFETVSRELVVSYQKGFLKPSFDSSSASLLHSEIFIAIATIIFMTIKKFRNTASLLFFAGGIYVSGFVILLLQNIDSNLWPLSLVVYLFYLALPALIAGFATILIMRVDSLGKK
jgi:hypothetical protein